MVESAIVFPIVILVLILLLGKGMELYKITGNYIAADKEYAEVTLNPELPAERVLRIKWMSGKVVFGND